jgi:hypothetical protein
MRSDALQVSFDLRLLTRSLEQLQSPLAVGDVVGRGSEASDIGTALVDERKG